MTKDLTVLAVDKAPPAAVRCEIPDGNVRGLFLVVQPTGRKSWAFRYRRADGTPRKLTIGSYPGIDLPAARRLASRARTSVAEAGDPAADKQVARKAARKPKDHEMTENVVACFLDRHAKVNTREASWREAERILNKEIVSRWRGKSLTLIVKKDIHALLDEIVDRGSPIAANRTLAVIRRFFSWAIERDIVAISPCQGVRQPSQAKARDRFLTDEELRLVWAASEDLSWPFGPLVQLLILTGQRRDEVGGMSWEEVDVGAMLWTLPRGRVKNDKGHAVPLSVPAVVILDALPRIASMDNLVFTTTGKHPVSGFANAKKRIDRIIAGTVGKNVVRGWTLHDLRRTVASGCARLGVAPQVVEAILNHQSGTIRGVAAVYNRYDHAAEKRAALDQWGRHIEVIVGGKSGVNVDGLEAVRLGLKSWPRHGPDCNV